MKPNIAVLLALLPAVCASSISQSSDKRTRGADLAPDQIRKLRIDRLLPDVMREHGVECWLVFTRESARDPIAENIAGGSVVARAAFVFYFDKTGKFHRVAIVASYDSDPPTRSGIYENVISYREEGVKPHLRKLIEETSPQRVAVDFSRDDALADGLTFGMRDYLIEALGQEIAGKLISAEDVVVSYRSRKLPEEIDLYQRAVEMTQQIIVSSLSSRGVTPGKTTEADIARLLEERTRGLGAEVAFSSVVVGALRGHSSPTETVVQRGDLIRIDFGISWRGFKTDIQRTAYVLREDENAAPPRIRKMWDTAVTANRAAVLAMKPGATGLAVDTAARAVVTGAGYREYPHATGHPVGYEVHDAGAVLGPDWKERYGSRVTRKLEINQLFAVEPAVNDFDPGSKSEIGIGLEEDVVIEKGGARYLGMPQVALILIR
ncbi:MAG TPA: M24 family metallopeptidase [Blastocatellia bacterium]|nr:M24 family metallopeptidase [Blastocatellia bacterium]